MFNTLPFYPLQPFNFQTQALSMSSSLQNMTCYITELQNVVFKQQNMINSLTTKAELQERSIQEQLVRMQSSHAKTEDSSIKLLEKTQNSVFADNSSETTDESLHESSETMSDHVSPKIMRRNGFKASKKSSENNIKVCKLTSKAETESQNADDLDDQSKGLSKAKHLWVNYGRRILEFAMNETKGTVQTKIKQLSGKLNSKRDFEEVFQVSPSTSDEDKEFKTLLGKLAIDFVKNKASTTFESSKYKQQMILQRHNVAAWIERLINP